MPWNPATGMFEMGGAPARPKGKGYGSPNPTDIGGTHRDSAYRSGRYVTGSLLKQERGTEARASGLADRYDTGLGDIEGTVGRFSDMYQKYGRAIADPAMRDFDQTLARTGANVASRFGGNVSSEELRQGYNTSDLFTRNLGEALARLGGEQVNAGLAYTGQLGQAAEGAATERDRLRQTILQGISMGRQYKPKKNVGDYVGAIAGGAASAIL